jgi:FtsZ-binding cell division protein ZapB
LQVAVLKQVVMLKQDKLRGECENSQVREELAVSTKEVEQLKEQLQSRDNEWQARLRAETDKWQAAGCGDRTSKMAEAVAGIMCSCFWEREIQVPVYRVICCYINLSNYNTC